jgi:hypothetical protein
MLVGFPRRTTDMLPFTLEALGFLMQLDMFEVSPYGRLLTNAAGLRKTFTGTAETVEAQRVARFLGREFARIGDRSTIYMTLGVRP